MVKAASAKSHHLTDPSTVAGNAIMPPTETLYAAAKKTAH